MPEQLVAPLLTAKQVVPPTRPGAIARPRLVDRLLSNRDTRLTVVVAGAGWGKTTLLSQWSHHTDEQRPVAWVSLDEADDEPKRFWNYALSALQLAGSDVGTESRSILAAHGLDGVDLALPTFVNELDRGSGELVLVLDDYHVLADPRIHESIEYLLAYLPRTLHLVIASRADPPLPLARMRARGELTEIRARDLRFDDHEAAALIGAVGGKGSEATATLDLLDRTEGWAAGLQLAALAMRDATDPEAAATAIRGGDRHILDYFAAEVLPRLRPDHRSFLVRTAVLDRMCGSLCDAVLERTGSADILEELDRTDMFVVPLDRQREWYRCHMLFRDVLRKELEKADRAAVPDLLTRAADWFEDHGHPESAIRLLIAAGANDAASRLLGGSFAWFVEHGTLATFLKLGEQLAGRTTTNPRLCLALGWAAGADARLDQVDRWCDEAERLLDDDPEPTEGWMSLRAQIEVMRASYGEAAERDAHRALTHARQAADLETDPTLAGYAIARVALGANLMSVGRPEESVDVLEEVWRSPARRQLIEYIALQAAGLLANALLRAGRAGEAKRILVEIADSADAIEQALGDGAAPALTLVRLAEGRVSYETGAIEAAREQLRRAADLASIWGRGTNIVASLTSLAQAELAAGDRAAARTALDRAREVATSEPVVPLVVHDLDEADARIGRGAVRAARQAGYLVEELTDRERSILRALQGPATQREIAAELYLSLNTVKGYTKSLYRKLAVATRRDAVDRGRELGLV